jgi:hypothetical protein
MRFTIGQRWIIKDGKLHGIVVEVFDEGRSGIVDISDAEGKRVDGYGGSFVSLLEQGRWQVVLDS